MLADAVARLEALGCRPRRSGAGWTARCPGHEDANPSLSVGEGRDGTLLLQCFSGCTFEGVLAALLGAAAPASPLPARNQAPVAAFRPWAAGRVWDAARTRAIADDPRDGQAIGYLDSRGLGAAVILQLVGVIGDDMRLPAAIERWPGWGVRVVAPLYDQAGEVVGLQGRRVWRSAGPKTLTPAGCAVRGRMFANPAALAVLRGEVAGGRVLLAEGLTDYASVAAYAPVGAAVVGAPGATVAPSLVGSWVRGRELVLALDADPAGRAATATVAAAAHAAGAGRVESITWPRVGDAVDFLSRAGAAEFAEFLAGVLS